MKKLVAILLLISVLLCGCGTSDRASQMFSDGTDYVDIHWWDSSFEEEEIAMRGEIALTRNKVFGDSKLQEAAKKATRGLELTKAADLLEYAARLTPAVIESGYLDKGRYSDSQKTDWKLYFIFIYNDGVASLHYDEKPAPEYENGYKLEYRPSKYDGGAYMNVSLLDGHIMGFEDSHMGLISADKPGTWMEEKEFQGLTFPPTDCIELSDVTLEDHFYSEYQYAIKDDSLFEAAPKSSDARLKDKKLQKSALELTKGLNLKTPEGMAEYAVKLGELLIGTDYNMCNQEFEIINMKRYTDGAWAFGYKSTIIRIDGKETTKLSTAYVSEEDGHIICMTGLSEGLILGKSDIRYKAPQVKIDKERSFFKDFKVDNGKVTNKCYIVLTNTAEYPIEVSLLADFTEDVLGGLLQEAEILGASASNHNLKSFTVGPGGNAFEIDFCGTFGGTMQKQDRLLPEIDVIIV